MRGVNHFNRQGDASEGSNESHVDCHLLWVNARRHIALPKLAVFSPELSFHGGGLQAALNGHAD